MILRNLPLFRMTFFYSPYDIWKITLKPEWYLQNNHSPEWKFSFNLMIFEKLPQIPNDTQKITSPPNDSSLFTLLYLKYNLKTRMILRKLPPLRMTFLYSYYEIWKITLIPKWYLENNHPSEWQFSIHLNLFKK